MKKQLLIAAIWAGLLAGCSQIKVQSSWHEQPVKVDGLADEWMDNQLTLDEKNHLLYGSVYDAQSLTVAVVFNDPALAGRMVRQGFTIWLDEDQTNALEYRGHLTRLPKNAPRSRPDSMRKPLKFKALSSSDFVFVQKDPEAYYDLQTLPNGAAAMDKDGPRFCLEFRIPRKSESASVGLDPDKEQTEIQIELTKLKRKDKENSSFRPRMQGRGGMGGGRQGGGGRRGAPPGEGSRDTAPTFRFTIELGPRASGGVK